MMAIRDNPTCEITREACEILKLFIQEHKYLSFRYTVPTWFIAWCFVIVSLFNKNAYCLWMKEDIPALFPLAVDLQLLFLSFCMS